MQRKRRHEIERYQKQVLVALFLFDLLYLNGKNLLSAPLSQRKRLLESRMKADATARIGTYIRAKKMTAAEHYFHEAISQGAEGVVIKGASSPYQAGHRGWHWIKFKKEYEKELADTFDVVIVGGAFRQRLARRKLRVGARRSIRSAEEQVLLLHQGGRRPHGKTARRAPEAPEDLSHCA
jgi:DNA ligase-1